MTSPPAVLRNPLVLSLTLDKSTQTFLTNLRSKYFPPSGNHFTAHLTLFRAIPPNRYPDLNRDLETLCQNPGFDVYIGEPRRRGYLVRVLVRETPSGSIEKIHRELLKSLRKGEGVGEGVGENEGGKGELMERDSKPLLGPHVTVTNRAKDVDEVERCLDEVKEVFEGLRKPGQVVGQKVGRAVGFEL